MYLGGSWRKQDCFCASLNERKKVGRFRPPAVLLVVSGAEEYLRGLEWSRNKSCGRDRQIEDIDHSDGMRMSE